jgi:large subunit ribosomal protein L25
MIKNIVVEVEERKGLGKNAAGRCRREGKVPGIVYGLGLDPFPVAVPRRRVEDVLKLESGRNTIFTLQLQGQDRSRAVIIRDLQRDPVSEKIDHVDFVRVDLERKIRVKVPIRLIGIPEGVKSEGGILEFIVREIEVECLPTEIPEHLDVDVSGLHINQNLSVEDLTAAANVKILDEPKSIIVVVAPPTAEEVAPVEAAETAVAEPELIKKGKEAAEDAEGKKPEGKKVEAKKPEAKK